jgi:hypothetical protein
MLVAQRAREEKKERATKREREREKRMRVLRDAEKTE